MINFKFIIIIVRLRAAAFRLAIDQLVLFASRRPQIDRRFAFGRLFTVHEYDTQIYKDEQNYQAARTAVAR